MQGTITPRTTKDGKTRYRAQIRINRDGIKFHESRTFSKESLAKAWLRQKLVDIERDPSILVEKEQVESLMLRDALERYKEEIQHAFGRSKIFALGFLALWPIASKRLNELTRKDYSDHVTLRRAGYPEIGAKPIAPSTAGQDLYYLRSLLIHAQTSWGEQVNITELDDARRGLSKSRVIAKSLVRRRLPTAKELQDLTTYFVRRYQRKNSTYPMHLIMWAAIYLCRRDAELCRIKVSDIDFKAQTMLVKDIKSPDGSTGNDKIAKIPDIAVPIIRELINAKKDMGLSTDDRLIPVNPRSVSTYFAKACLVLGIEDLRLHDLRHEGATRLAEDGLTIPKIQQVTLHESWSSLQVYVNVEPRGERLDFDKALKVASEMLANR